MKNLYLRAKCILNDHSNNNAPEYEENSINVEVTFPQAITADELSIRIYNNDSYKEMGVGYHYNKSYKKFKKVCLNISSSEDWENQHLKAYVIIDNEVKWQCSLFLHEPKDNYWTKQILRRKLSRKVLCRKVVYYRLVGLPDNHQTQYLQQKRSHRKVVHVKPNGTWQI
mgnify:CR=1 FL=1